ncbi:ADP-ribosylglycohydrolase family protein [Amycolatopsis suaedae]|uniref:ADP-ribosylglycohydrolase family protein n=1 Tax=Amycolatopsis suaedae TaxID=2510978 RepID=A0A4Q7J8W4_9PSEU|nr:ADP-ribosylglycohydrolase family protein [Amycolatopsis suaedae]RZQ62823.1 ADP-ribosylglycohydrolase family protein [Amycolatopsis suaedae]
MVSRADRFRGSLLAGAVGDALGFDIEFDSILSIRRLHGPDGLRGYANPGRGLITDDTQMTLFTLEGLIRAHVGGRDVVEVLQHAYQRWLYTQGAPWERDSGPRPGEATLWQRNGGRFAEGRTEPDGWLVTNRGLLESRAPGNTCMRALRSFANGGPQGTFTTKLNDSKGCGGVMRAAPCALWPQDVFTVAAQSAALTHSHPSGYLSAGALAVIVRTLLDGAGLRQAVDTALAELVRWDGHQEQLRALENAIALAGRGRPTPETIAAELGGGWVGEEALAIAVCAALVFEDDLGEALLLAVNHSGDSDSTGAICGNILGALHGPDAIPAPWLDALELRDVIDQLAVDGLAEFGPEPPRTGEWLARYPGW